jgi:hypothetical protein
MRWVEHLEYVGRNAFTNSGGKWPFVRTGRGWENNVDLDLRRIRFDCLEGTDLARDEENGRSVLNTAMDLGVP